MTDDERSRPAMVHRAGLEREFGGQEAIDALGDSLDDVARQHGMSADRLRELLLQDRTARIGRTGRLFYRDPGAPVPGVRRREPSAADAGAADVGATEAEDPTEQP